MTLKIWMLCRHAHTNMMHLKKLFFKKKKIQIHAVFKLLNGFLPFLYKYALKNNEFVNINKRIIM